MANIDKVFKQYKELMVDAANDAVQFVFYKVYQPVVFENDEDMELALELEGDDLNFATNVMIAIVQFMVMVHLEEGTAPKGKKHIDEFIQKFVKHIR